MFRHFVFGTWIVFLNWNIISSAGISTYSKYPMLPKIRNIPEIFSMETLLENVKNQLMGGRSLEILPKNRKI